MSRRPQDYTNGQARAFLVTRDGRVRGLLWGTMHVGYGEDTALPRPIRTLFAAARDLRVETVVDRLTEPELARLRRAQIDQARYDPGAVDRLDTATRAALSNLTLPDGSTPRSSLRSLGRLVSAAAASSPGLLPEGDIVDVQLIGFARALDKPVGGLDTLDDVLPPASDDPNSAVAAAELRQAVQRQDGARPFADWVRAAYARGDIEAVTSGIVGWRATADDLVRNDAARTALFTRRNAAWLPTLERSFATDGFHFVAFGAGHLIGADGVVALLRDRGWSVTACIDDRCPAVP